MSSVRSHSTREEIEPPRDMSEISVAVREAQACGARVLLGDRDYEVRSFLELLSLCPVFWEQREFLHVELLLYPSRRLVNK